MVILAVRDAMLTGSSIFLNAFEPQLRFSYFLLYLAYCPHMFSLNYPQSCTESFIFSKIYAERFLNSE